MNKLSGIDELEDDDNFYPEMKMDLKVQIKNFPVSKEIIFNKFQDLIKNTAGDRVLVERGFELIDDQLYLFNLSNSNTKNDEEAKKYTEELRQYKQALIQAYFEPKGSEIENKKINLTKTKRIQLMIDKYKSKFSQIIYNFYF